MIFKISKENNKFRLEFETPTGQKVIFEVKRDDIAIKIDNNELVKAKMAFSQIGQGAECWDENENDIEKSFNSNLNPRSIKLKV